MTGDLGLGLIQRRAEIADAQFSQLPEQQDNTQTGFIGQVFEKLKGCKGALFLLFGCVKHTPEDKKNNHIFGKSNV
jgi:hypothetical protein